MAVETIVKATAAAVATAAAATAAATIESAVRRSGGSGTFSYGKTYE